MDYLSVSNNIYIKMTNGRFGAYDYNNKHLTSLNFEVGDEIYFEMLNEEVMHKDEIINLFSEILYFIGHKKKNVVFNSKTRFNNKNIGFINNKKNVSFFEEERKFNFDSINDLYKYPYLVPWNLVPREYDVVDLVEKYSEHTDSLLEIGSGYGKNLKLLEEKGYNNCIGIEYSINATNIANKIVNNCFLDDITDCHLSDNSVDRIIDIGCLHCVDEELRENAISEVSRILKKNGIIIGRYFLPKNEEWLKVYPVNVSKFGATISEIRNMFKNHIKLLEIYEDNECVYYVGRNEK